MLKEMSNYLQNQISQGFIIYTYKTFVVGNLFPSHLSLIAHITTFLSGSVLSSSDSQPLTWHLARMCYSHHQHIFYTGNGLCQHLALNSSYCHLTTHTGHKTGGHHDTPSLSFQFNVVIKCCLKDPIYFHFLSPSPYLQCCVK